MSLHAIIVDPALPKLIRAPFFISIRAENIIATSVAGKSARFSVKLYQCLLCRLRCVCVLPFSSASIHLFPSMRSSCFIFPQSIFIFIATCYAFAVFSLKETKHFLPLCKLCIPPSRPLMVMLGSCAVQVKLPLSKMACARSCLYKPGCV